MSTLNWSSSYIRAFKRIVRNNSAAKEQILKTMELMKQDPFSPKLKTHKLKGVLEGTWACSVDYDLRIVFDFVKNPASNKTEILLINIGTHEEVY